MAKNIEDTYQIVSLPGQEVPCQGEPDPGDSRQQELLFQVIGEINDDALDAPFLAPVKQGAFEPGCRLVMKDLLPAGGGNDLRQDDDSMLTIIGFGIGLIQKSEQRFQQGAVLRFNHHELYIRKPCLPLLTNLLWVDSGVDIHVNSGDMIRNGAGEIDGIDHAAVDA